MWTAELHVVEHLSPFKSVYLDDDIGLLSAGNSTECLSKPELDALSTWTHNVLVNVCWTCSGSDEMFCLLRYFDVNSFLAIWTRQWLEITDFNE